MGSTIMLRPADPRSRRHIRLFLGQASFLVLASSPALLLDGRPPVLFLLLLRNMFGLTALLLLIAGLFSTRQRTFGTGFGLWDHCLAFALLQLGCSIALRLLAD